MEELADECTGTVVALKALGKELRIRNAAKLAQAARGKVPGASLKLGQLALENNVGRQTLAPAYRSTGKSAAEGVNERLQIDLIDFSQNTKNTREKYAVLLADVYSRRIRGKAILNKRPETVNAAVREILPTLVGGEREFSITSDLGKEFAKLEEAIPGEAVHREKQGQK